MRRYPDMPTAADVVNALDQQALASILRAYGEEKHAKKIASAIVQARGLYPTVLYIFYSLPYHAASSFNSGSKCLPDLINEGNIKTAYEPSTGTIWF